MAFAETVTPGTGAPLASRTMTGILILPKRSSKDWRIEFPDVSLATTTRFTGPGGNPGTVMLVDVFVVPETGAPLAAIVLKPPVTSTV